MNGNNSDSLVLAGRANTPANRVIDAVIATGDDITPKDVGFEGSYRRRPTADPGCEGGLSHDDLPEALLGDHCPDTNEPCNVDRARTVAGVSSDVGMPFFSVTSIDFYKVGAVGQVRAAIRTLYALGAFNIARTVAVIAGATATATLAAAAPLCVGVVIDWGVGLTSYAPFTKTITTSGYVSALGAAVLDRSLEVRVRDVNGGRTYLPFAQRTVPGMTMAQVQVATAPVGSTVVEGSLPAGIAAAYSMAIQHLAAFSPLTAFYARGLGIFDARRGLVR